MFKLEKQKDKAVLTIYGYVGGMYLDEENVKNALDDITKAGYKKIDFHLHTYGGTVFTGNLICNFLEDFKGEIDLYIDGVAASMGSIFLPSVTRVHIADNGFIMIHSPRGGVMGTAKDMMQNAKLLESMEKNFVKRLSARIGKTEEEVKAWFDGTDYWFDADEAVAMKLADTKIPAKVTTLKKLDKTEASQLGAKAIYDRFAACLENPEVKQNSKTEMNKADLIKRYNLTGVTAESTDEEVLAAVDAKLAAGKKAEKDAEAAAKLAIEKVVDKHIEAKVITKEQKAQFVADGEKLGIERLEAILGTMKPYQPVTHTLKGKESEATASGTDTSKFTWKDFQDKGKDNKAIMAELEAMPEKDPERFEALYQAEFGVKAPK